MISFLQKLAGIHDDQKRVDARFRKNLNGMAARNQELEELRTKLRGVAEEAKAREARASLTSSMSGEHQLLLGEGVAVHGTEEGSSG
jgi:hypothetical protein